MPMPVFNWRLRLLCARRFRPSAMHCGTAIWSDWCRFASPPSIVGIDEWADVPPVAVSRSLFSSMSSTRMVAAHRTAKYRPRKSAASTETFPRRHISRDSIGKLWRSPENPGLRSSPSPARAAAKVPRSVSLRPYQERVQPVQVFVRDNDVNGALRVLKKKMQREGVFREMKLRRSHEKPSERRVRERAEAVRRYRKAMRKRLEREGY